MVNSKRISQSPEASEYPWRFETRIQFEIEPKDWSLFAAPKTGDAPGKSQTSTEPSKSPKQKTSGGSAKPDGAPEAVGQTAEVKP
jgi:hypothetical protein